MRVQWLPVRFVQSYIANSVGSCTSLTFLLIVFVGSVWYYRQKVSLVSEIVGKTRALQYTFDHKRVVKVYNEGGLLGGSVSCHKELIKNSLESTEQAGVYFCVVDIINKKAYKESGVYLSPEYQGRSIKGSVSIRRGCQGQSGA